MFVRMLTLCLSLIFLLACAPMSQAADIKLTDKEQAFIDAHPVLHISNELDYPPFDYAVAGEPQGYSIDILNMVAARTGLTVEYVNGHSWSELMAMFRRGELDLLHTASKSSAREKYALFSDPYYEYRMHFIVRKGEPEIRYVDDLVGKVVVTSKGWAPQNFLHQNYPDVKLLLVKNMRKQIEAVASGRADVMISGREIFHYMSRKMGISNLKPSGWFREMDENKPRMFHVMVPKSAPELQSILNKGLASITPGEFDKLREKWFGSSFDTYVDLKLTPKEQAYIRSHSVIKVCNETTYAPYDYSVAGVPHGYSIDMLNMLAQRAGLRLKYVQRQEWNVLVNMFQKGELDILHTITKTKDRENLGLFSDPYYRFRSHFVIPKGATDINSPADLKDKTVALSAGWFQHSYMQREHPNVALRLEPDPRKQIEAVLDGKADVAISNPDFLRFIRTKYGIDGVKQSSWFKDLDEGRSRKYYFVTQKNAPELLSILNKALATVTPGDLDRLHRKWFGHTEGKKRITLTLPEQAFVERHPVVVIGGGESFEPYIVRNADGSPSGHDVELARKISERTGLAFEFAIGPWRDVKKRGRSREIDGLASAVDFEGYKKFYNASQPYVTFMNFVFVKRGNRENFHTVADLAGKRVAVQRGNALYQNVIEAHVHNPKVVYVDTIHDLLSAVASGQADYTVLDETAYYVASQIGVRNMIEDAFPLGEPQNLVFQFRKDWPEAVSIFNKGLQSIPSRELTELRHHWFYYPTAHAGETLVLSENERRYLRHKGVLKACVDVDWAPFSSRDSENGHSGMSADYLKMFVNRLGVKLKVFPTQNWSESMRALRSRKCDLSPMMKFTERRAKFLDFTTPYMTAPYVIVTRTGQPLIKDIETVRDRAFAVLQDFAVHEDMQHKYPDMRLLPVRSPSEGLRKVQSGEAYGYIGTTAPIVMAMQLGGIIDLKINGKLPYGYSMAVGTRNDEPILRDIFQRAVDSLSEEDHRLVQERWLALKVEKVTDYRLLVIVLSAATVIVLLVTYWNRKLKGAQAKTEKALSDLSAARKQLEEQNKVLERLSITDRLTQLFNRSRLDDVLDAEIQRARRQQQVFGLILMDIDRFKAINDTYGHKAGDVVLIELGHVLMKTVRVTDVVGRWGGEEFLIICTGTNIEGTSALAEKIRQTIECRRFPVTGTVTASFGVTAYSEGDNAESMVDRADKAMYQSKHGGRNCVHTL